MKEQAEALRTQGLTYEKIGQQLGISTQNAWRILNKERQRKNQKESVRRYLNRNKIPLCEVPKEQLYDVYVFGKKVE